MPEPDPPRADRLQPAGPIRRVQAVVNSASGSVGRGAGEALEAVCRRFGLDAGVAEVAPREVSEALKRAVGRDPDLLIVLAGDGTACMAGEMCGPDGPLLAPLPGGTMNMLPNALYGGAAWRSALEATLEAGSVRPVSGGVVDGRPFHVAAILGSPAWWAPAREAVREGRLKLAWLRGLRAARRTFGRRLRFRLDGAEEEKAEALTFMCPLVSRAYHGDDGLEAAALDPRGAAAAFRLGARTLFADLLGDWRDDPAVRVRACREAQVRAHGRIPIVLDGEPHRIDREATVTFKPTAFRALVPSAAAAAGGAAS